MGELRLDSRDVHVDIGGAGMGRITVGGVDLSGVVQGVDIHTQAGDATVVVLRLPAVSVVAQLGSAEVIALFEDAVSETPGESEEAPRGS